MDRCVLSLVRLLGQMQGLGGAASHLFKEMAALGKPPVLGGGGLWQASRLRRMKYN